jgi:RHS repeat-associated protein
VSILRRLFRTRLVLRFSLAAIALMALASSRPEPAIGKMRIKTRVASRTITGDVTPYTMVVPYGTNTVDVDVFWCSDSENEYLTGGADFSLDGQDVSSSFSLTGNGNQDYGCEMWWRYEGTITIPDVPGDYGFESQANGWPSSPYAYANFIRPYKWQQVKVTADPANATVTAASASSQAFVVWNLGAVTADYTLSSACSGSGVSSCSLSSGSLSGIAAGDSGAVTVTYTAGSGGSTGTIRLIATDNSQAAPADTSLAYVSAQSAPSTGVTVARSLGSQHRGACLTVALAGDAAMECGDLRITHALPEVATMGQLRAPVLLYNSALAKPSPVVQADVTIPCSLPTTVEARVYLSGVQRGYGSWSGSDWGACGNTRRISIPVDLIGYGSYLYFYTVQLTYTGGAGGTSTSSAELVSTVDRSASSFGAGWWLSGLERLEVINGSLIMWIGGDGSTRVYSGSGSTFLAATFDRYDTLTYNSGTGEYTRQGAGNVDVKFNPSGYHVSTTNRQGHVTRFTYVSGTDRLDSLIVPVRSGTPLAYKFVYTSNLLDSIIAPPGAAARNVKINRSGATVTSIRDADGSTVSFGYLSGANANVINSRTDRRSNTTYYTYNSANHLTRDSLYLGSSQFIRHILRPAESASLTTALSLEASYTSIDGPRTDAADITKIWVSQFGQPTRVRDGEGVETAMKYDGTWPGLVSETRSASGHLTRAFYSSTTGLLESLRSYGPLGGNDSAVTSYVWDAAWRSPIRVVSPTGVVDTMAYDGSGNRTFAQRGRNSARRVNFTYTSDNLDSAVTLPSGVGSPVTRIARNALGNVSSVTNPKGYVSFSYQNAIGQDTLIATPFSDTTNAASFSSSYYTTVTKRYSIMGRDSVTTTSGPSVTLPSPYSTTVTTEPLTVTQKYDAEGNLISTRRVFSYNSASNSLADSAIYDAANRLTNSITPSSGKGYTLDPAGNVTGLTNGRGTTVTMVYDRANRMIRKIVPQVEVDSIPCTWTGITWPQPMGCNYWMPTVRGVPCIDADTAYFAYNGVGRLQRANNRYARIARAYNPNGSIKAETQSIRSYYEPMTTACNTAPGTVLTGGNEWASYSLTHTYDLAGNRTGLDSPVTTGCTGSCTTTWAFADTTGLLASVTDESAGTSYFTYDVAMRLTTISTPGSWSDSRTLDALGNTSARTVSGGSTAISDAIAYDASGRIKKATVGYRGGSSWGQDVDTWYNPHGAVLAASGASNATGCCATELFLVDAIGNRRYTRANNLRPQTHADVDAIRDHTINSHGQLTTSSRSTGSFLFDKALSYDASSNVSQTRQTELDYSNSTNLWIATKSWYAADDKLAIFNRAVGPLADDETHAGQHTVYEEYRYDAFGRRVGTRKRMAWSCSTSNSDCASSWTRTVWDGDQLLMEIRSAGATNESVFTMETVYGAPTSSGTNAFPFGRVRYVHAGGIDQPLAVVRYGMTGSGTSDPYVMFPHANWRGQYESGHKSDGTFCYASSGCFEIAWPGARTNIDGEDPNPTTGHAWFGTLITGNTDGSGQTYLRNRYYDPATGRFTQEDPIGLAGGMNAYGFASGDRVNFGDPFGLCPPCNGEGGTDWVGAGKQWFRDRANDAVHAFASVNAMLNPMAQVLGGLMGRDPTTGEKVGPAGAGAMVGLGAIDVLGGPAIDVKAGRAALGRMMAGEFTPMAGKGTSSTFRAAGSLGGNAADWAYVTSREVWEHGGYRYQAHWALNTATGETSMAKLKMIGPAGK